MANVAQHPTKKRDRPDNRLRHVTIRQWRHVVIQSARDLWTGSVLEWASSLAFYAFLSLFPMLIASLIVASYIVDAAWATQNATGLLDNYLPGGDTETGDIIESAIEKRQQVGFLSFIILLITGRRILGVLTKGLNHVSDVGEQDDPLARKIGVELALVVGLVALGLLALAARPLVDAVWGTVRIVPGPDELLVNMTIGAVRITMLLAIFVLVYAYVPLGERHWPAVFVGAAAATALFLLAEEVFGILGGRIWSNLGMIYGPLALAAVLLSWFWYVGVITLVCGGLASHVKVMVLQQRSAEQASQEHLSG